MKSVAIIGAGACGLVLANLLSEEYNVTLFEKNNKLGKKILASGNGKCNFTNTGDYKNKYNNAFANIIVDKFNNNIIREYFSLLGLAYRVDEENRAYPLSESSNSVLDVLKKGLKNVRILLDSKVYKIESNDDKVDVYYNDNLESFDYLVCCSGSSASNLGSEHAYLYLKDYGVKITNLNPSLTPLFVKEDLKSISGVRVKCLVNLYKNEKLIYQEKGEVLFKDNSLSGIVIYNMSSMINRDISASYKISLDLISDIYNDIEMNSLVGVLHPKLVEYVTQNKINDIKNVEFNIIGFDKEINAQVISGGVDIDEVNEDLSLKRAPNIYVGGELLDCDGMCGGYNLQFAFSCAFMINESLKNKKTIR